MRVGEFGMNTPAFFAVDNFVLRDGSDPTPRPTARGTVHRNDEDLSNPLEAHLLVDDASEADVPPTVVIPAGADSADFDIEASTPVSASTEEEVLAAANHVGFPVVLKTAKRQSQSERPS